MTTQEIANRLIELIRAGDYATAQKELYSNDITSIENPITPNSFMQYSKVTGMEALAEKGKKWEEGMEELFDQGASNPIVTENAIAISIWFDAKMKGAPERSRMEEIGVYSIKDGKIVREEFVY